MARGPRKIEKPKNTWKTVGTLLQYMGAFKWMFLLVLVVSAGATILQTISPRQLGKATTIIADAVMKGPETINGQTRIPVDFDALIKVLLVVTAFYAISSVLRYLQNFILSDITQHLIAKLRQDMRDKLNRMPLSFVDKTPNGEILSRAVNDVENVSRTFQQTILQIMMSSVQLVGTLWIMFSISIRLSLVILLTLPLVALVLYVIMPRSQRLFAQRQKIQGQLNSDIEENYAGQIENKAFNQEQEKMKTFSVLSQEYYESSWRAELLSGILMPSINLIKNVIYACVGIYGVYLISQNQITIGDTQAMLQYAITFSQPMRQLADMMNQVQSTIASAERIFEFIEGPEMDPTITMADTKEEAPKVEFQHVRFSYTEDKENPLMKDVNLKVEKGKNIAIVGPTGAGKTTLINLLERFYDVDGGKIMIDGADVRSCSREEMRAKMAMVLQDTWLFNGTVYDNIAFGGHGDVSEEEVYRAAKIANVDDFIQKMPQGYDTILDEDASNLSQGQKQLLTIARAVVSDPQILILDEATSNIDTRTETLIQKAMDNLMEDRTSFVIAHRLSTIRDADQIVVMKDGDVIESGNHDELMAQKGFYYDLYESQFENSEDIA